MNIKINILTRTGNREKYFSTLKSSILNQTYENIRHIKSNDNIHCKYLEQEIDVISVDKKNGKGFYNLYLNKLLENVNEGWVIILDDDSKLIDNTFIEKLAGICNNSNENDVLIYQSKVVKTILPFKRQMLNKKIILGYIDMSCFCFHFSLFKKFKFDNGLCGDYNFLNKLKNSKEINFRYLNLPVGIWANYDGAKGGKN